MEWRERATVKGLANGLWFWERKSLGPSSSSKIIFLPVPAIAMQWFFHIEILPDFQVIFKDKSPKKERLSSIQRDDRLSKTINDVTTISPLDKIVRGSQFSPYFIAPRCLGTSSKGAAPVSSAQEGSLKVTTLSLLL